MHRFFVIEARRLLPLLFLLVLLVSLSIYDNFFREHPVLAPEDDMKNAVAFINAARGEIDAPPAFAVIDSMERWADLRQEYQALPDYPFNAVYEYAVSAVNGEIKSIQVFTQEDGTSQVQVRVNPQPRAFHVVTVERDHVGLNTRWLFLDGLDRILHEVVITSD
jgi:hypothetical protein